MTKHRCALPTRLCLAAVLGVGALVAGTAAGAQDPVALKLLDRLPPDHYLARYATQYWIDEVEQATGGAVTIKRYPSSSLGKAKDMPALVAAEFPLQAERCGIFGHSMGGHGALVLALRNPGRYASVSAFSPIVAPSQCPWGEKALGNYLGPDRTTWQAYDSCALIRAGAPHLPMLVDQGEADNFLETQLQTGLLEQACADTGFKAHIRRQPGYDHSYFFIATFVGEHIAFHARMLADS
ncbi:MAG: alpha/beta hydrolase-fold protein [Haliea sp.]